MVRPKKVPKHQWKIFFSDNSSANFILKILFIFAIANKGHSDFAFFERERERGGRDTHTERQRERGTERQRGTKRGTERQRDRENDRMQCKILVTFPIHVGKKSDH